MSDDYPKLRPLEVLPVAVQGRQLVCLRDPLGFAEAPCCIEPQHYFIVSMFDGEHSILDIQAEYMKRFGDLLMSDDVRRIAEELDGAYLMESENFEQRRRALEGQFRAQPVRPAVSAGGGYPEEPAEIREQFDGYLAAAVPTKYPDVPRGLVAPHIDFERGGECYGHAYAALRDARDVKLFVLLGVAHGATKTPFVATAKSFETPLGTAPSDRDFVNRLAAESGMSLFEDEWAHKNEHSLEFQVAFLQHLFGDDFRMVPILCSSFEPFIGPDRSPSDCDEIMSFVNALRDIIAESREPICVIAGADLAHVGPQFGDPQKLTPAFMSKIEEADRESLGHAVALDHEAFYRHVLADNEQRRVCGVTAIYTLLAAGDFEKGQLIQYSQAVDDEGHTGVTFASAAFY